LKVISNFHRYWKKRQEQLVRTSEEEEKIYEEIKKKLPNHKNNKHSLIEKLLLSAYRKEDELTNVYESKLNYKFYLKFRVSIPKVN